MRDIGLFICLPIIMAYLITWGGIATSKLLICERQHNVYECELVAVPKGWRDDTTNR